MRKLKHPLALDFMLIKIHLHNAVEDVLDA